ncbi:uncharacterized protein N7511_008413 [Penicillium nucicola]|uniref:uncharacterized protein n=1 Tax=Penicillium nucicola TaxID=1850975 RepID=UPI002544E2E1|nr:uncharacterized protein N7511_008413 [Penicillium nucicola]KAJ5751448.1 hypothetical protein N7511_008413 [Penicillium nucicola]
MQPFNSRITNNVKALHVITSVDAGISDIPPLLQGQAPPSKEQANLGTQEYGKRVEAIIAGGGYNDSDVQKLRGACKGYGNVPWLRHDISKEIDPRQPTPKEGIEYGEEIAKKIVDCLNRLRIEEKMGEDGVYWF